MSMVAWSDTYSVEIQELDEQHKCLINIINELYNALAKKADRDIINSVFDKLVEYTKIHFTVEESLMRIFHYPHYEEHKAIHDHIVEKVVTYQGQYRAGNDSVGMELLLFLKEWLFKHINEEDKRYSSTFIKHGAKRSWVRRFW